MKIGTCVFAKMKGFPFWPGVIVTPPEELMKAGAATKPGHHCVFFFGSKNYSWIESDKLKPYAENKDLFFKSVKHPGYKKSCDEVEEYIKKGTPMTTLLSQDPFDSLISSTSGKNDSAVDKDFANSLVSSEERKQFASDDSTEGKRADYSVERKQIADDSVSLDDSDKDKRIEGDIQSDNSAHREEKVVESSEKGQAGDDSMEDVIFPATPAKLPKIDKYLSSGSLSHKDDFHPELMDDGQSSTSFRSSSFLSPKKINTLPRPESPPVVFETTNKSIRPSSFKKYGFIGLGKIGGALVRQLLTTGHDVTIWNRSLDKCSEYIDAGADGAMTPCDLIERTDITFCCVSDPPAALEAINGVNGVLSAMTAGKGYVEMSGIDPETSQQIAEVVTAAGGRYLEVRFQGTSEDAATGSFVIMAGGDRSLYDECESCFASFGIQKTFLGNVKTASGMFLLLQNLFSISICGLSEVLISAKNIQEKKKKSNKPSHKGEPECSPENLLDLMLKLDLVSEDMAEGYRCAQRGDLSPKLPVKNLRKDLELALEMSGDHQAPLSNEANELMKGLAGSGFNEKDVTSIFLYDR